MNRETVDNFIGLNDGALFGIVPEESYITYWANYMCKPWKELQDMMLVAKEVLDE